MGVNGRDVMAASYLAIGRNRSCSFKSKSASSAELLDIVVWQLWCKKKKWERETNKLNGANGFQIARPNLKLRLWRSCQTERVSNPGGSYKTIVIYLCTDRFFSCFSIMFFFFPSPWHYLWNERLEMVYSDRPKVTLTSFSLPMTNSGPLHHCSFSLTRSSAMDDRTPMYLDSDQSTGIAKNMGKSLNLYFQMHSFFLCRFSGSAKDHYPWYFLHDRSALPFFTLAIPWKFMYI